MQRQRRRFLVVTFLFTLIFVTLVCIYYVTSLPLFAQYDIVRARSGDKAIGTRTILLWSSFFGDERWSLPDDILGPEHLRDDLGCTVYQCELSNQHNYLPALELYDAIVFHVAEPFPLMKSLPAFRTAQQTYVFALQEPPGETKHILSDEQDFYNLTMTYRLDSDIVWPYSHLMDIETGAIVAPSLMPHWRSPPDEWNDTAIWQLWPKKTKMAAWFVSHCNTLSERERLAAALQQYISVDIFGKCGPLSCKRGSDTCHNLLDTQYKFYFAFENSLCTDYVTEKLFEALERYIVPVVYGGADYTRFLPPHSYIDAEHFESTEALSDYLRFVASDVNEYMRFFWWRRYYKLTSLSPFCALCAYLHSNNLVYKRQTYTDIESWWLTSCRLTPKLRY